MRYEDHFTLKVDNFRAIHEATIGLNGITVVAGINGSGKSTLSKLLYHTFYVSQNLEKAIVANLLEQLAWFDNAMDYLLYHGSKKTMDKNGNPVVDSSPFSATRIVNHFVSASRTKISEVRDAYNELYFRAKDFILQPIDNTDNIVRFIYDRLSDKNVSLEQETLETIIDKAYDKVKDKINHADSLLEKREIEYLRLYLTGAFEENVPMENYHFYERGSEITDYNAGSLAPVFSVKKAAYLDTPFIMDMDDRFVSADDVSKIHWTHLLELLKYPSLVKIQDNEILKIMQQENILNGEIRRSKNDMRKPFVFVQDDNEYNLKQCATGIKSIAILYWLLSTGFLNDTTMLIIDEPEAHLHPAWIVEYARLLVLLHKHHGVRFFIATHSPDMVSALKYIGENEMEDAEKRMGFYLAEKLEQGQHRFVFKSLGMNIGKIHGSFNISIKKTDEYGGLEEKPVYL